MTNIGRRQKVLNDKSINCLFAPNTSNIILIQGGQGEQTKNERAKALEEGASLVSQVSPDIWLGCGMGAATYSAYDVLRSMLHEITGYNESITLTTVPIYHLEPNTRIYVRDSDTGINGDYMINSYSVPLTVGGTMSFSCSKAVERI